MMDRIRGSALIVAGALTLSSCAPYSVAEPERHDIGGAYSVQPQTAWNHFKRADHPIWTKDGRTLQALHFFADVKDGQPLIKVDGKQKLPTFERDMRATEVAQLVADTLKATKKNQVEVEQVRPATFDTHEGFHFKMSFRGDDGVAMKAVAEGFVSDKGRLNLIYYEGTQDYYHAEHLEDAKEIFRSVQVTE